MRSLEQTLAMCYANGRKNVLRNGLYVAGKGEKMKKIFVPVLFVVCFGLMFYFAYVDHQKEVRIQAELSGVDVCGIYLGEDPSYDETVKSGYKAVCYVLSVENRSHHKMDNMIMEQIGAYPNITTGEYDTFGEGRFDLLPKESGTSVTMVWLVPESLTDDEILKSLSNNELHIQFDVDKRDCTLSVARWRKGTQQEIKDYMVDGLFAGPAKMPEEE